MGQVMVIGSLNADLVARVDRHPRPGESVFGDDLQRFAGGKGGNQAVAARTAGAGVVMVGCVGDDDAGRAYLERLDELGVAGSPVRVVPGVTTGHALVVVDESAENTVVVIPGANAHADLREAKIADQLREGDVLLLQLELPVAVAADAARAAAAQGARVVLNLSPYAAVPQDVLELADPVVVNEHEAALLADSGLIAPSLLVTFGAAGAVWDDEREPGTPVDEQHLVDTTGAGDAFCGALAAALAAGCGRSDALASAVQAGAAAVTYFGAQPDPQL